jgi:hypothetical protein
MAAKLQIKNGLTKRLAHFSYAHFYFLTLIFKGLSSQLPACPYPESGQGTSLP